jgi:hypothetical protein
MPGRTGTHDVAFLLKSTNPITNGDLSFQEIADVLNADTEAYNQIMRDMLGELASFRAPGLAGRIGAYGGSASGSMKKVGEYGQAPTQRAGAVAQVAFPLDKYQYNLGWTAEYVKQATPADLARQVQGAQQGHRQRVIYEVKVALFAPTNVTFDDHLTDGVDLAVKRLVNADGATIPNGPNAETFDGSTHTHYLGSATLTTTAVDAAIATVIEHGHGAAIRIYIAQGNEVAFRALTGFSAYLDPRLTLGTQANHPGVRLDLTRINNRPIGIYGAAEVWVKSWMPANYLFVFDAGSEQKPLGVREQTAGSLGLNKRAEWDDHPLHVDFYESFFGIGALTRTNGAALRFDNATYAAPTITVP